MATSLYFNNFNATNEQNLIEDLIIESIKIHGIDTWYMPRVLGAKDELLNEDDLSHFNAAYMIEMYIRDVDGFGGEGDLLSKFGVQIRDSMTLTVAIRTFDKEINNYSSGVRPKEGDVIYFPLNGKIFEVMHVEHEAIFYQLGSLQVYDLRVELFEYSGERFNTGNNLIDTLFDSYDLTSNTAYANVEGVDLFGDNQTIESEANTVLDFTELNPFGDRRY